MNSPINILRIAYHLSRRRVKRTIKSLLPKENPPVLFVFGGRSNYWLGMGATLYHKEPAFKASIQRCDVFINQLGNFSILPSFEGTADKDFFNDEIKVIVSIASLQIALTDLWYAKGIQPDGVLGVSTGELIALYAAGGLSLKDTMTILKGSTQLLELEKKEYVTLLVSASLDTALQAFKDAPGWIEVGFEFAPKSIVAYLHVDDKEAITKYLDTKKIGWRITQEELTWPYHTSKISRFRKEMLGYIYEIEPMPLKYDFYSARLGKLIPKNTVIGPDYYYETLCNPVLFNTVSKEIVASNFGAAIHIGPHPLLKSHLQKGFQQLKKKLINVESMRMDAPDLAVFRTSLRQVKDAVSTKPLLTQKKEEVLAAFCNQLNINSILSTHNPYNTYEYLRRNGKMHFLKQHNAWLLLDYEDIDFVIQNPQIYSSNVLYEVDRYLLGADPPDHTVMRAALQPLFATQGSGLDEFIKKTVNQLLDNVEKLPAFNFVEDFSLPLSKMIVYEFLGLKKEDSDALEKTLTGHTYEIGYLKDLEIYFTGYLERIKDEGRPGMGTTLLAEVEAGRLPFAGAVSLMKLMWLAGTSTTSILLTNAINMMLRYPAISEQLRASDRVIPKFIEECLRVEPPELQIWRLVKQDTELAGKRLTAGSLVILSIASANRDHRVFNNPDEIVLNRPARKHFTFGGGFHYCLGVAIARLEAKISIQAVIERLPNLKFVDESQLPTFYPSHHFRAIGKLMVTNA